MFLQKLQLGIIIIQKKLFCQKNHAGFVFLLQFVLGLPHGFILISN